MLKPGYAADGDRSDKRLSESNLELPVECLGYASRETVLKYECFLWC